MYDPTIDRVAEYLEVLIAFSGKTQMQIAKEAGFKKPNFITMLKQGRSKIPLEKVPALATALGVDPAFLLWMCYREYHPALLKIIEQTMGRMVTDTEFRVVSALREVWGDELPWMEDRDLRDLADWFGPL